MVIRITKYNKFQDSSDLKVTFEQLNVSLCHDPLFEQHQSITDNNMRYPELLGQVEVTKRRKR